MKYSLLVSRNWSDHNNLGNVFRLLMSTWIYLEIGKKSYWT